MPEPARRNAHSQFATIATPENPLALTCGTVMEHLTLAYETHGTLNAECTNGILLFHALSGNQHAAGHCGQLPEANGRWTEDCHRGWWDLFIGPGKALDTEKFFIVCANYLGGCYGTTGPASINPASGRQYAAEFPQISTADVVRAQGRLLDQ
ncbi:MAG: homoserine O-acetyltransferase, partial [Roseimicrobium sp.]